jgi:hypothetical protein
MKHDLMSYRVIPRQRNREVNICVTVWSHLTEGVHESSARIGESREIKDFAVYENWARSLLSLLDKNAEEVTKFIRKKSVFLRFDNVQHHKDSAMNTLASICFDLQL